MSKFIESLKKGQREQGSKELNLVIGELEKRNSSMYKFSKNLNTCRLRIIFILKNFTSIWSNYFVASRDEYSR